MANLATQGVVVKLTPQKKRLSNIAAGVNGDEATSVGQLKDGTFSPIFKDVTVNGVLTAGALSADSVSPAITAKAGGGQSAATALTKNVNIVTVCATAGDSVTLPEAVVGLRITVANLGATALAVFPYTGDTINDEAADASVTIQPESVLIFNCYTTVKWQTDQESLTIFDKAIFAAPTAGKGRLEVKAADNATDTTTTVTNASQAAGSNRVYTIPDAGASANFILSEGAATINGVKTFGSQIASAGVLAAGTAATTGYLYSGTISVTGAGTPQTLNTLVGTVEMTGVADIIADAGANVVINNSLVTANTIGQVSLQHTTAAAGSTPRVESVVYGAGTITISLRNSDPATATGIATYKFSFVLFKL